MPEREPGRCGNRADPVFSAPPCYGNDLSSYVERPQMIFLKIMGTALLALIYTISPIDIVPDVLPVVGWADDAGVIIWAWTTVGKLLSEPAA